MEEATNPREAQIRLDRIEPGSYAQPVTVAGGDFGVEAIASLGLATAISAAVVILVLLPLFKSIGASFQANLKAQSEFLEYLKQLIDRQYAQMGLYEKHLDEISKSLDRLSRENRK